MPALGSSHREAPAIGFDPSADITDLYAFVSPDKPDTATLIANYNGFQEPGGGPNFYPFNPDVLYWIKVDNTGVTLKGMLVKIEAQMQAEMTGMMTSISGDGMLQTKGGITMMQ